MSEGDDQASDEINRRAKRMKAARGHRGPSPLRGIGVFGMIGWSVAVPVVGGTFLGIWLDRVAPQSFSWTLTLIVGGVLLGGVLAWRWVQKEGGDP